MAAKLSLSHHYFHALCFKPSVTFQTQRSDEEVLLTLRKHPITQIAWMGNIIVLLILLLMANIVVPVGLFNLQQLIVLNLLALVFIFSYVWANVLNWFYNVGIVTNIRIIDIDFYNAIYKEITEAKLFKISDLTAKTGGFFGSFFNFGDVFVKTEGHEQNIEFEDVPTPSEVASFIDELVGH